MATGDPSIDVTIYFLATMGVVGAVWNAFQIWERCKQECRPPEEKEVWDGSARLMLENVHEAALGNAERLDVALEILDEMDNVIMREDDQGQKMVYYPKSFIEGTLRKVSDKFKRDLRRSQQRDLPSTLRAPRSGALATSHSRERHNLERQYPHRHHHVQAHHDPHADTLESTSPEYEVKEYAEDDDEDSYEYSSYDSVS